MLVPNIFMAVTAATCMTGYFLLKPRQVSCNNKNDHKKHQQNRNKYPSKHRFWQ